MPVRRLSQTELARVAWHVSTYSEGGGVNCVEAGPVDGDNRVAVRDTKDRARGHFTVGRSAWAAFVQDVARRP